MKKLFISAILSCMFIFIVWTIVAYVNYGNDMSSYRLDLYATFVKFQNTVRNQFQKNFYDLLKDFKNGIDNILNFSFTKRIMTQVGLDIGSIPTGFKIVLTAVTSLLEPVWGLMYSIYVLVYAVAIVFELVVYLIQFVSAIYEFVLNPVFIRVSTLY